MNLRIKIYISLFFGPGITLLGTKISKIYTEAYKEKKLGEILTPVNRS